MHAVWRRDCVLDSRDKFASFNAAQCLCFVLFVFVMSNVPLLAELAYIAGCAAMLLVSVQIVLTRGAGGVTR